MSWETYSYFLRCRDIFYHNLSSAEVGLVHIIGFSCLVRSSRSEFFNLLWMFNFQWITACREPDPIYFTCHPSPRQLIHDRKWDFLFFLLRSVKDPQPTSQPQNHTASPGSTAENVKSSQNTVYVEFFFHSQWKCCKLKGVTDCTTDLFREQKHTTVAYYY